ncbi:MAG: hypothetical protein LBQ77_02585 [Treponema sp.]|jgi:tetratricopeptide (TPR) repeat protein|nr:hypothetical protein [Treponema sp.]
MGRYFVVFFFTSAALSFSAETAFPQIEAESWAYQYASLGQQDQLMWQDITRLSLHASGISASQQALLEQRIFDMVKAVRSDPALPVNLRERGEYILTVIHSKFLKKYSSGQTRIDTLVQNGTFNCVSSAVFYMIFARAADMEVQGIMTHDHAFVSVNVGTKSQPERVDVETTNKFGFDPGNKKEFQTAFGQTGFVYTPAHNYRDRTNISQLELISLIITNRMSDIEKRKDLESSITLAANRAALLSNRSNPVPSSNAIFPDPIKTLTDRLRNYGAFLSNSGYEAEALQWSQQVQSDYPDPWWEEFNYATVNNWVNRLVQRKQFSQARQTLNANADFLTGDKYAELNAQLTDSELVVQSKSIRTVREAENFLVTVNNTYSQALISTSRATEMRSFAIAKIAEIYAKEKGTKEAMQYLESTIALYGSTSQLNTMLRTYRANRVSELHNTFARLWNSGNKETASIFLKGALEEFPDNAQLLKDWSTIN